MGPMSVSMRHSRAALRVLSGSTIRRIGRAWSLDHRIGPQRQQHGAELPPPVDHAPAVTAARIHVEGRTIDVMVAWQEPARIAGGRRARTVSRSARPPAGR